MIFLLSLSLFIQPVMRHRLVSNIFITSYKQKIPSTLGQDHYSCGATRLDAHILCILSRILTYADLFTYVTTSPILRYRFCSPSKVHSVLCLLPCFHRCTTLFKNRDKIYLLFFTGLINFSHG